MGLLRTFGKPIGPIGGKDMGKATIRFPAMERISFYWGFQPFGQTQLLADHLPEQTRFTLIREPVGRSLKSSKVMTDIEDLRTFSTLAITAWPRYRRRTCCSALKDASKFCWNIISPELVWCR